MPTPAIAMLGWPEVAILGLAALLLFGRRVPGLARALGRSALELQRGLRDDGRRHAERLPTEADDGARPSSEVR